MDLGHDKGSWLLVDAKSQHFNGGVCFSMLLIGAVVDTFSRFLPRPWRIQRDFSLHAAAFYCGFCLSSSGFWSEQW